MISENDFLKALAGFSSRKSFLEHLAVREEPHFFLGSIHRREFVDTVREVCPEVEAHTINAADQTCDHIFDLLGSGPTQLGEQIDWYIDFKTGHRFDPHQYYADVRPAPYPGGYDIKVPWELSRCQHFVWLGQAYWFANDEKYAQEFVDQILDWIEQNPPQFGVNWACTMDVAIRAVNWLWGYYFFKDSPSLDDDFILAFFKSLLVHGRHIIANLEWSETLTSNHYLSNLVGLVYIGILCPEFKEARRWREFSLQELEKEMFKQVYPDGVDFEASTSYHRLVTEIFLSAVILAQKNGHAFSQPFMERLEKMVEFVMYATKPDGTVPLIGDHDNGRLHRLKVWDPPEREWVDFRYLLAIGAVLFEREDFARMAGDQWEEAIWLFGQKALAFKQNADQEGLDVQLTSRGFPDAGWYLMRHKDHYMFISAGSKGQNGNGGHAHNDSLNFEFFAHNQGWIVDSGTYIYTGDYKARNLFRSTASHNTILVDYKEQQPFLHYKLFSLKPNISPRIKRWDVKRKRCIFDAEHDGYQRLSDPVKHRRRVSVDFRKNYWVMEDFLTCNNIHEFTLQLHCAPGIKVKLLNGLLCELFSPKIQKSLFLEFTLFSKAILEQDLVIEESKVSRGYGSFCSASTLCLRWRGSEPTCCRTEIREKT